MNTKYTPEKLLQSARLASDLIDSRELDDSAETMEEILAKKPGSRMNTLRAQIGEFVKDGKLERVWKYYKNRLVSAYRLPKTKQTK